MVGALFRRIGSAGEDPLAPLDRQHHPVRRALVLIAVTLVGGWLGLIVVGSVAFAVAMARLEQSLVK